MREADFVECVLANPAVGAIARRLESLDVPDAWLTSGCLFQTAWNVLTGRAPQFGIRDYDVFYFDDDRSPVAEERTRERIVRAFADLDVAIDVRNQARVHEWYEADFGVPYSPLRSAVEGIDRFLVRAAMVGLRREGDGWRTYAPAGFEDIEAMVLRPNRVPNFTMSAFEAKAARWMRTWPELRVVRCE